MPRLRVGVIHDVSGHVPYRLYGGRIVCSSITPPIRKDDHTIHVHGYGVVETAKPMYNVQDMRSFRIVDVTRYINKHTKPTDHMFELHIATCVPVEPHKPTGVVRGIDVGGKHLAAIVGTNGDVIIHNTRHKYTLYEIDALTSLRDHKKKDSRRLSILNDKIKRLQKTDGIAGNCTWQSAARIVSGADATISETLYIKGMTAHGGNRKRKMNRSMTHNVRTSSGVN